MATMDGYVRHTWPTTGATNGYTPSWAILRIHLKAIAAGEPDLVGMASSPPIAMAYAPAVSGAHVSLRR